jgi:UDP-GlcNAc:undecaprenyl-phosphate GlcNAc-1-phosphate transferase
LGFALLGGAATPIGLGLAGALVGFLVFNRPPASIYLGDAGAYFVGTIIALLPSLTEGASTSWSTWWAVPLLLGLPVADTAIAILRRWRTHRPLLQGDRSHVYDQLVDGGASIGQSTVAGIGAQVLLTGIGLAATQTPPAIALAITLATACALAILATRAGLLDASAA